MKVKECPKCAGTGLADSGGVQPWGEPILIECDCHQGKIVKVKTSELSGVQLDYAVAKALGFTMKKSAYGTDNWHSEDFGPCWYNGRVEGYRPSTNWIQCGQLMTTYQIFIEPPHDVHKSMLDEKGNPKGCWETYESWHASVSTRVAERPPREAFEGWYFPGGPYRAEGETPQIAICRAVVAAKLGDEVDIPDELMEVGE